MDKLHVALLAGLLVGCGEAAVIPNADTSVVDASVDAGSRDAGTDGGNEGRDAGTWEDAGAIDVGMLRDANTAPDTALVDAATSVVDAGFDATMAATDAHGIPDVGTPDGGPPRRGVPVGLGAAGDTTCALDDRDQVWCWGYDVDVVGAPGPIGIPVFVGIGAALSDRSAADRSGSAWYVDTTGFPGTGRVAIGTSDAALARRVPRVPTGDSSHNLIVQRSDGHVVVVGTTETYPGALAWTPPSPAAALENDCAILADGDGWCWNYVFAGGGWQFQVFTLIVPGAVTTLDIARYSSSDVRTDRICYVQASGFTYCDRWMDVGGGRRVGTGFSVTSYGTEVESLFATTCALQTRSNDASSPGTPGVGCVENALGGPAGSAAGSDFDTYTRLVGGGHDLAGGDHHLCVIQGVGVLCWGRNTFGQLGNGTTTPTRTPTPVAW